MKHKGGFTVSHVQKKSSPKNTIEGNKDSKHEECVLKRGKERKMVGFLRVFPQSIARNSPRAMTNIRQPYCFTRNKRRK
jgi:hypothetical protein